MKRLLLVIAIVTLLTPCQIALAQGKATATPEEAVSKVSAAAEFLSKTGEDGIRLLGDPKKGFMWKDSFVWVARCESNSCFPNPRARASRLQISEAKCFKTGKLYILDLCDRSDDPHGAWTTYYWRNPKTGNLQHKAAYMRQVPGQRFQVVASVFDEDTTIRSLEKISHR